jgi:hypothetical protein
MTKHRKTLLVLLVIAIIYTIAPWAIYSAGVGLSQYFGCTGNIGERLNCGDPFWTNTINLMIFAYSFNEFTFSTGQVPVLVLLVLLAADFF